MKSVKELRKTANKLVMLSFDEHKELDTIRIEGIINLISSNSLDSIGIKVERSQIVILLKFYSRYLKNLIREKTVTITTANTINSSKKLDLEKIIQQNLYKSRIIFETDSTLIGGIKIQNGWDIIDNTIANKLHKLKF